MIPTASADKDLKWCWTETVCTHFTTTSIITSSIHSLSSFPSNTPLSTHTHMTSDWLLLVSAPSTLRLKVRLHPQSAVYHKKIKTQTVVHAYIGESSIFLWILKCTSLVRKDVQIATKTGLSWNRTNPLVLTSIPLSSWDLTAVIIKKNTKYYVGINAFQRKSL